MQIYNQKKMAEVYKRLADDFIELMVQEPMHGRCFMVCGLLRTQYDHHMGYAFIRACRLRPALMTFDLYHYSPDLECAISFYYDLYSFVTAAARHASVTTMLSVAPLVSWDVARIIGKLVYDSRFTETNEWWHMKYHFRNGRRRKLEPFTDDGEWNE